jgi:uncharacterized membrane protein YeaQ/YmgE (transglycosylase-associated protein family)
MSILIALTIGLIVGGVGGFIFRGGPDELFINCLAGIVGSIIGLAVFYFGINQAGTSVGLFSPISSLCSIISALILTMLFNGLQSITPKRLANQSHVEEDGLEEED